MFAGKPVIGVVGGIGSGKSFVADLFGELGCLVIKSDDQVREAYKSPEVQKAVRQWWGDAVFDATGEVKRQEVAKQVFADVEQRRRLEALIHPMVGRLRDRLMQDNAANPAVRAYVWDTPLLYEVGLERECDAVVFVEVPEEIRLERVMATRGWDSLELKRRENSQMALDKKRSMAQYIVRNIADAAFARRQVEAVLSRILTQD